MFRLLFTLYFKSLAVFLKYFLFGKDILILDIDNTLAYTFESLISDKNKSNKERLATLTVKKNVITYIENKYPKHSKIFLSARSHRYYWLTFKWLKTNRLNFKLFKVLLVPKASNKLWFLRLFSKTSKVVYFDDLSYNHEKGEVLYYQDVIEEVKRMDIIYYEYKDILEIDAQN